MASTTTRPPAAANDEKSRAEKTREDKRLEEGVKETFPASDPPSETQPGGGITGPEAVEPKKKP